jgi:hypothetical protein
VKSPEIDLQKTYTAASIKTANDLKTIAHSVAMSGLSHLSLPEIDEIANLVGRMIPAGNVPGVILSGLARLPEHTPSPKIVRRDLGLLFKGVEKMLDTAVYGAFFAGPATVIWAYQNLLKLAGKDPQSAFPEGTWQFYVDYALREDTARHANETHGFDTALTQHQISLDLVDRMTAWTMTAIHCLHQYNDLLINEWRERVFTALLIRLTRGDPDFSHYTNLYREWQRQLPYKRGKDAAPNENYPQYRRRKFNAFLDEVTRDLPAPILTQWNHRIKIAEATDLPAYQRQMSILGYLEPGEYGETRTQLPLDKTHIGLIYQGTYYLIPACLPGGTDPTSVDLVRRQIAGMYHYSRNQHPSDLTCLATCRRAALPGLRSRFNSSLVRALDMLRLVPVLLNFDQRRRRLTLSSIRQSERGIGDHALTIFDTGETFVFDQSHIYFDGGWGAVLAEILTNEALSWAVYLKDLSPAHPGSILPYSPTFHFHPAEMDRIQKTPHSICEAGAETDLVNIKAILRLRKLFKRRNDLIRLTVNDLLVLYRAIHAVTYQPSPGLASLLQGLSANCTTREAAEILADIDTSGKTNPAILIPVDASLRDPRERLYPMTFEVPLDELDLLGLHKWCLETLTAYKAARGDRTAHYAAFDETQRTYLATLAGFGEVMSEAKEIAIEGKSVSVGSIKLLAHLPTPLQRLFDLIPGQFDLLNDIIKGREVFSNLGAVAPNSTLTRFITAKDDNEKKILAWGVVTDADGVMRISLRDFRPHVAHLNAIGRQDLAIHIAQDYLDTYARGLNEYVQELHQITLSSRETQLKIGK